jgi:uncharacterized membrane protein
MAFCANCGAQMEGAFCAKCGSPAAVPAGTGAAPAGSGVTPVAAAPMADNVASALCYLLGLITGIVFLVLAPYNQNRNVRFHAFQSIFLHVALIIVWIVITMFLPILHLWLLLPILVPILSLAFFVLWLFMLLKTWQGQKVVLPIVGELAQKQA